jgi:hypothetical protein
MQVRDVHLTITNSRGFSKASIWNHQESYMNTLKDRKFSQNSEISSHQFDNSSNNNNWICYLF